ncbi:Retrovirus-related Pol polyprotein from transposon 17.6-like Protein [Tribolium castaneum]|uniref:Retrovirus-related Pol polyprotein from transposon 17.6-like Protein n=1 Tax=Tribolium castaneum TaxID=7070 RepID=D6WF27_TRICA|nr:Retrovirus-related Pol polyprotein from transposon 17.6-like Protein [Tribolium castaneum]
MMLMLMMIMLTVNDINDNDDHDVDLIDHADHVDCIDHVDHVSDVNDIDNVNDVNDDHADHVDQVNDDNDVNNVMMLMKMMMLMMQMTIITMMLMVQIIDANDVNDVNGDHADRADHVDQVNDDNDNDVNDYDDNDVNGANNVKVMMLMLIMLIIYHVNDHVVNDINDVNGDHADHVDQVNDVNDNDDHADDVYDDNDDRVNDDVLQLFNCAIRIFEANKIDIFYCENLPLTFNNQIKHYIRTKDNNPIFTKTYRYQEIHKEEVRKQINSMLTQGIIRPSTSPWSSPIWIVKKKLDASGKKKWRLVVDYRQLNEKTVNDKYPLPNITDILDKLGKSIYFTTLDLASGFHQVQMNPDDIEKTAFSTENGHYEYLRMPFGLKNAPATFQRVMDNILREIQNEKYLVYLDDIIIFSTSLEEHIVRLKDVFEKLRNANFKIQLDKSESLRKEVAYLGHIITPEGVKPNPEKIKAIMK